LPTGVLLKDSWCAHCEEELTKHTANSATWFCHSHWSSSVSEDTSSLQCSIDGLLWLYVHARPHCHLLTV